MKSVFQYKDYRAFLNAWIEAQPGRGTKIRLSEAMGISPSMMSLVLKGDKTLSPEQATELIEYLSLNDLEGDYFLVMLEIDRAGSHKLKQRLNKKKETLLKASNEISSRIQKDRELTEDQKSIYYSSWLYTGLRNLSACSNTQTLRKISEHLAIPVEVLQPIVDFLIENDLCKLEKGELTYNAKSIHLGSASPYVNQHHKNWRNKAFEKMDLRKEQDLFFTGPMSLSKEACEEIRKLLPTFIQQVMKVAGPSDSEVVSCLNIDWFEW
jgi:uncharacterized protein (TIGR02147 family)